MWDKPLDPTHPRQRAALFATAVAAAVFAVVTAEVVLPALAAARLEAAQ